MFQVQTADRVTTLTLSHPPVNAISEEWVRSFEAKLDALADAPCTVLHIRSDQKVFCAGADLKEVRARMDMADGPDRMYAYVAAIQRLYSRIEKLPQVTLAEIGGAAMGGGYELALGCDLRIAANEAKLGLPEPGLGLLPGGGGTQRLTWIAGPAVAARIILTAEAVDGKTARELGMVQWAVPRAELEGEAKKIAARVAGLHPLSLAACKVCIRLARDPERNGFAAETEWTGRLLATEETQRRVADFLAGARR